MTSANDLGALLPGWLSTLTNDQLTTFQPLVSGTEVTFRTDWPKDGTETSLVPAVGNAYFYAPLNPNLFVNEDDQVDVLNVYNGGSPSDDSATLNEDHLGGLGMPDQAIIAGRTFQGDIT